jgi:hypothetical protein
MEKEKTVFRKGAGGAKRAGKVLVALNTLTSLLWAFASLREFLAR